MKKIALIAVSAALSFAMSAPTQNYLDGLINFVDGKTFSINGLFYMYDFEKDGQIQSNDWLFITNDQHHTPYRLMGKTPTANDAFGWLRLQAIPADLQRDKPAGYFIFINYPKDQQLFHTNAFSWFYAINGSQAVFKLMGAKPNHDFDYLDIDGDGNPDPLPHLHITLDPHTLQIHFSKTTPSARKSCEDEQSVTYAGMNFYTKRSSWYSGDIVYNCKSDAQYEWGLAKDAITIDNIEKVEKYYLQFDNKRGYGTDTYDYASGSVHTVGTYDGKSFDCYEYYKKVVPITVQKSEHDKLQKVMEEWGTGGPCDPDFIRTTCPNWYYDDLQQCTSSGEEQQSPIDIQSATTFDVNRTTDYTVHEENGKIDKIHTEEIYKKY